MPRWCMLDPGLDSKNLGDQIISLHARAQLANLLDSSDEITFLPTHRLWSKEEAQQAKQCTSFIFAGSNVFSHNFPLNFQWVIRPSDLRTLKGKLVFFGVGAWTYGKFSPIAKWLWSSLLYEGTHSVRDSYSLTKIHQLGKRALNTGCPTLWGLPDSNQFGHKKSKCVITLTDYRKEPKRDAVWLNLLRDSYDETYLWPQGEGDEHYFRSLDLDMTVKVLSRDLESFESILDARDVDYFGTRLHAGIHALHRGIRTSIVGIDNRANEMARDFNIPVVTAATYEQHFERNLLELRLPRPEILSFGEVIRSMQA